MYKTTQIRDKYGFRIVLVYSDDTIQTIQRSGFRTKKEAEDFRNRTIVELHNGTFVIEKGVSVQEFFSDWLENEIKPRVTHQTYVTYRNIIYNHILKRIGKVKILDLNRGHITNFYHQLASYSHTVLKNARTIIRTALQYALNNKIVNIDASKDVELPKQVKFKKYRTVEINTEKTLTIDQVKALIEASKETPIYLEILFASLMGLRKGEIRGLKYEDIDYINRTIRIQRQLGYKANAELEEIDKNMISKQEIKVKTHSSNRELEIPDVLFDAILVERNKYEKNRNRRINDKTWPFKDLGYICCSTYGHPRSSSFSFKYYKQLLKDNNLPDIRFHDLRATYCTMLVKENFNLKAISKMMGHASEIVSIDVYADNAQIVTDCLDELEPFIDSVKPKLKERSKIKDVNNSVIEIDNFIQNLLDES